MILKKQLIVLLLIPAQVTSASVRAYNYSPEVKPSVRYSLKAGGQTVLVTDNPIPAAFAAFETDQAVPIEIACTQDVKWVDIRPVRLGIKPVIKDNKILFTIPAAGNYTVEINGKTDYPLFIFANPPEIKPNKSDPNVIYFEAGKIYTPGVIHPKSNQQVYIEGGAIVIGAVAAQGVENVKVSGYGILDGTYNNQLSDNEMTKMFSAGGGHTVPNKYQRFVEFIDSKNLTIEGIILNNSTTWQVVPINCDNVTIRHLKIISDNPSDDGIDVVRSRSVHVTDCFVRTKDDCVAIKAHLDYPDSVIVDNVLVDKCIFWNAAWGNGLEIGFELQSAEVKNITFSDCDIIHVETGAVFSIHNSDKATVKNVLYKNIRVEDARQKLVDLAIFRSRYCTDGSSDPEYLKQNYLEGAWDGVLKVPENEKAYHAQFRGHIENIRFDSIFIQGIFPFSIIAGYDDNHQVKNVTFNNIYVNGQKINSLDDMRLYKEYSEGIFINKEK
jgi:hypothetical protein